MENNNIIPFTMEIKSYHAEEGIYQVEYRPINPDYQNIQLAIGISLTDTDAFTEEKILQRLASCSPQYFWQQQELAKTFDSTLRNSLVGQVHEDAHELVPVYNYSAPPSPPTQTVIPETSSDPTPVNIL